MLRKKDDQILNEGQIRSLYPHLSFGANTFAKLGWEPYFPPQEVYVPPIIVSPRQIRQALNQTLVGDQTLRTMVEAAVTAGNQDLKDWWEFATAFEENHPLVVSMANGLGLGQDELHRLFALAQGL